MEQVGEQPHQEGGEDGRPVLQVRQLHQRDQALPLVRRTQEVLGVHLRLTEERVGALVGERDQLAQDHPRGGRGEPAQVLQVRLALVGDEELYDGPQVREVEQREAGLVGVVEHQPER
jgi:hypothetical protein